MDAERILQLLWTEVWQIAAAAIALAAIVKLACRHRPHLAYALWLVVLLKCLTPPLWSSPTGVFSWTAAHHEQQPAPRARLEDSQFADRSVLLRAPATATRQPIQIPPLGDATAFDAAPVNSLALAIFGIWLSGSIIATSWFISRVVLARRKLNRACISPPEELLELTAELCRSLGIRSVPQLVITRQPLGPAPAGLFRPRIVIPAVLVRKKSPDELRPILAHELVHLRRRDLWVALVQCIVRIVWWFHPAVWLLDRRLECLREQCCDEEAIAGLNCEPSRYAKMLLNVLQLRRWLRHVGFAPGMSRLRITSDRLDHIMGDATRFQRRAPKRCWMLLLVGSLVLLPGTGIVLRDGPVQAQTRSSAAKPAAKESEPVAPDSSQFQWALDGKDGSVLTCRRVTLYGKVTDPAGHPLAGATVRIVCSSLLGNLKLDAILNRPPRADSPAGLDTTYKTDAKGNYQFTLVPDQPYAPSPNIGAEISCAGFARQVFPARDLRSVELNKETNGSFFPKAAIAKAEEIKGTIVDPSGKPLAGVRLAAGFFAWSQEVFFGDSTGEDFAATDSRGQFRLVVPQSSDVKLFGRSVEPEYIDLQQKIGLRRGKVGTIRMVAGQRLSISVVDLNGKPLAGVPLEIDHDHGDSFIGLDPVGRTDRDGRFLSRAVPQDTCVVMAFDQDGSLQKAFDMQVVQVSNALGLRPIVIHEVPHVTFRGHIVDTRGKPIDTVLYWTLDASRDPNGRVCLHTKQPGTFSLTVPLATWYPECTFMGVDHDYEFRVWRKSDEPIEWPKGLRGNSSGIDDLIVVGTPANLIRYETSLGRRSK